MNRSRCYIPISAFALLLLLMMSVGQVFAATISVDEDCSIYNAVRSANNSGQVAPLNNCESGDNDSAATDVISIDASTLEDSTLTLESTLTITTAVVIDGGGSILSGGDSVRLIRVNGGSLTVNNTTLTAGYSSGTGGAIEVNNGSLTLNNSVVSESSSVGRGGGIHSTGSDLTLSDSAVSGNSIDQSGNSSGGGIYYQGTSETSLIIERSGIDGNSSRADGGGLYIKAGSAQIKNSTFGENSATGKGGGIYNNGEATITHATIANNQAASGGGLDDAKQVNLYNSLLSGNTGGDCAGTLNSNVGNLIKDGSCGHDELTGDPLLMKLAGLPIYYVLGNGSPAVDAADSDRCLQVDQRGIKRAKNACDIGAAEYEAGSFSFQIQAAQAAEIARAEAEAAKQAAMEAERSATPEPSTCETMPAGVIVSGYAINTQCQQRDASGVGNKVIVDYGFTMAIDIWGFVPAAGVEICFAQPGVIILLDATTSPRTIAALDNTVGADGPCAVIDREGTAVLIDASFLTSGHVPSLASVFAACTVTTTDVLNLRNAPAGDTVLRYVASGAVLDAIARSGDWFKVNYFGVEGWISAGWVITSGACQ